MRSKWRSQSRPGVQSKRAGDKQKAKLCRRYFRSALAVERLEQRFLLSAVVELNAPSTNYATSWTNSGAVAITGVKPTLESGLNNPRSIAVSAGDLWVANQRSNTIGEYNASTGAAINASLVSGLNFPTGIAVSGGDLWVANGLNGSIGEYNATSGTVVNAALITGLNGLNGPFAIAVSGGDLWVSSDGAGTIGEYNATTGAVINASLVSGLTNPIGIAVSGGNLWVANAGSNTIGQYNATTGAAINTSLVSGLHSPSGIALSGGNLWVGNSSNGTLGEYNATTGAVVNAALLSGFSQPDGLAVSGANLWVADNSSGTIGLYNATTGAPLVANVSITDSQSTTLNSLTVTIASPHAGDTLTATASGGITVTPYNPTTGVLSLSGTASLAAYQTVLASVQYNNTSGGPGVASETIDVVANDGISNSSTAESTITISAPPIVELDAPSTNFATSWTNSGAVPISVNGSPTLVSGLSNPYGIAVSGGTLWIANYSSGTIGEYNATTGAAVNAALISGLSAPAAIVVSGANLWVTSDGGGTIGEYNATTGAAVNATLVSGLNGPYGIALSGGNLWVTNYYSGTIGEYNATTGAVVNAALVSGLSGPFGIAVSGGNLWVADNSTNKIGEYNATTGAAVNASLVSGLRGPCGIALSGANLWVTNQGGGTIGEYNATTGAVVNAALISGLDEPYGIAVSGTNLWAANYTFGTIGQYNATTGAPFTTPSIIDGQASTLSSLTVTLASPQPGDILTAVALSGVTIIPYNPSTGVLRFIGNVNLAAYQTMLASVQYDNTGGGPDVASETIDVVANDGISNSNTAISTITINVPPVVELDAPSANYSTSWTNSGPVGITVGATSTLISGLAAPVGIAVLGGNLYVLNADSGTIGEYNATTGDVVNAALVSGLVHAGGMAVSNGNLYVTDTTSNGTTGVVSEYNATTGAVVNASLVSGLSSLLAGIAVSGGNLWVTTPGLFGPGSLGEYNATTGAVVNADLIPGLSEPAGVVVSGANLWVTDGGNGTIGEYNATTGAAVNASLVSGLDTPYGIAMSGGNLWVTDVTDGTIRHYDATTGAQNTGFLVSGLNSPIGIAMSGANLWVANNGSGTIGEYNATTGAPAADAVVITDGQSAMLNSMTVTIESPQPGDVLTATASGGITVTPYNPTTGVLQLSGAANLAAYQTVLGSVQYNNTNQGPGVASETIDVVANDGISNSNTAQSTIRFTVPKIVGVQVDGSAWSSTYLAALHAAGDGNGTGYSIPVGSTAQSAPLPWTNVNQIQISFNEEVNIQQSSLTLSGVNQASYAFSGFTYNTATRTATWTLSGPINNDKLSLDLHSTGPFAVTDSAGKPLDGEWTNGTSTYPSGNGVVGGDFNFGLNVLSADASQDGVVNGLDINLLAGHWLQSGGVSGDLNGDDVVNGLDLNAIASHWLATLPAGGAGGGSAVAPIVGSPAAVASEASCANMSSLLGLASVSSDAVSAGLAARVNSTFEFSAHLLGLPAPSFANTPALDRVAAFMGRPDVTKIAATIDHLLSEGTGGQSHALGLWAVPENTSLGKSQFAAGSDDTADSEFETASAEHWTSPIDDELLATLALGRR
jgi:streptogramin lyase